METWGKIRILKRITNVRLRVFKNKNKRKTNNNTPFCECEEEANPVVFKLHVSIYELEYSLVIRKKKGPISLFLIDIKLSFKRN